MAIRAKFRHAGMLFQATSGSADSVIKPPGVQTAFHRNRLWLKVVTCAILVGNINTAHAGSLDLAGIGGAYTVGVTSLKEARFHATKRQQFDFSCGSAALATLLTYQYGRSVDEQAVFEGMYASGDQVKIRHEGFSLLDMKRYLKTLGYEADGFVQPLDKLADAGLPAIVLISEKGYHHFVVLKGLRDGRVLIGDPATGTRAMSRSGFQEIWQNRLLFVIHNNQQSASFNNAQDWRAAPVAPVAGILQGEAFRGAMLPKLGPGDY